MVKVSKSIKNVDIRQVLPSGVVKSPIQTLTFKEQQDNQEDWIKSIYRQTKKDPNKPGDWSVWSLKPNKDIVSGQTLNGGNIQEYVDNLIDFEKLDWGSLAGREEDSAIAWLPRVAVIGLPYYGSTMDVIGLNPLYASGLSKIEVESGIFDGEVIYTLRNVVVRSIEIARETTETVVVSMKFMWDFELEFAKNKYKIYGMSWFCRKSDKNNLPAFKRKTSFINKYLFLPLTIYLKLKDRDSLSKFGIDSNRVGKYNLWVQDILSVNLKIEPQISLLEDSGMADITDGVFNGSEVKVIRFTPADFFKDVSRTITEPDVISYYQIVFKTEIKFYGSFIKMIEWKVMSYHKDNFDKVRKFLKKNKGKTMSFVCWLEDRDAVRSSLLGGKFKKICAKNVISFELQKSLLK